MGFQIKGFGWKQDLKDPRDFTLGHEKVRNILRLPKEPEKLSTGTLPPAVDNRKYCTSVDNQGSLGSSTANAAVGMCEYYFNRTTGTSLDLSRLFLYKATRLLMGSKGKGDSGANIRTTLKAIRVFGIPNEEFWPYTDDPKKFDKMPESWIWSLAKSFSLDNLITYFRLDYSSDKKENIDRMKEYVAQGYSLDFGFVVFGSYCDTKNNGGIFPYPAATGESIVGGHCALIVGYDDNKASKNPRDGNTKMGCFLIRNSWGESWGDNGYGWIPYGYFISTMNGDVLASDVWTMIRDIDVDTGEYIFK